MKVAIILTRTPLLNIAFFTPITKDTKEYDSTSVCPITTEGDKLCS